MTPEHQQLYNRYCYLYYAASDLIADVRKRHPNEDLQCPFMKRLEAALEEPKGA